MLFFRVVFLDKIKNSEDYFCLHFVIVIRCMHLIMIIAIVADFPYINDIDITTAVNTIELSQDRS